MSAPVAGSVSPAAGRPRVVWVVGGSGTLGAAIAEAFVASGARVVVSSRRAATHWRESSAGGCSTLALDLTSGEAVGRAAQELIERCGRIDVLVNCAAAPIFGDVLALTDADWDTVLQTKLHGYLRTMRAVLPAMAQQGGGAIVNVSGRGGRQPTAAHLPGCCANAAVNVLTKGLADVYAGQGIRINAVAPGPIDTPRHHQIADSNERLQVSASRKMPPVGRLGYAQEIADAVLYLASPQASYISGITLPVDGGGTATV